MNKSLRGMHAGLIATGPMTVSMVAMQSQLNDDEKSPFPPATISNELVRRAGLDLSETSQTLLTTSAHLTYGAMAGIIYSETLGDREEISPAIKGMLFGSLFWAANYFILLPSINVRASGFKMTPKRNAMMLISHLVWGASLGYLERQFKEEGLNDLAGSNKAPKAE